MNPTPLNHGADDNPNAFDLFVSSFSAALCAAKGQSHWLQAVQPMEFGDTLAETLSIPVTRVVFEVSLGDGPSIARIRMPDEARSDAWLALFSGIFIGAVLWRASTAVALALEADDERVAGIAALKDDLTVQTPATRSIASFFAEAFESTDGMYIDLEARLPDDVAAGLQKPAGQEFSLRLVSSDNGTLFTVYIPEELRYDAESVFFIGLVAAKLLLKHAGSAAVAVQHEVLDHPVIVIPDGFRYTEVGEVVAENDEDGQGDDDED